jgi:hypothetical protein
MANGKGLLHLMDSDPSILGRHWPTVRKTIAEFPDLDWDDLSCEVRREGFRVAAYLETQPTADASPPADNGKPEAARKRKRTTRGRTTDRTTKVDLACDYIRENPERADISPAELAAIVGCDKSLLSRKAAKRKIEKARAVAKSNVQGARRGFSTNDHQADAKYVEDWNGIDDQIDS